MRDGFVETLACTEFPPEHWRRIMRLIDFSEGRVHADAIMDRIVHNAVLLEMGDMNMRQAVAGKGR